MMGFKVPVQDDLSMMLVMRGYAVVKLIEHDDEKSNLIDKQRVFLVGGEVVGERFGVGF